MGKGFKSGFVGIIGRPNVGKSTLLNQMLGKKVAIMSDKAQTTRNKIHGIYTDDTMQAVFLDTPGVHKPKHKLGEYMNKTAGSIVGDVDVIFYLVDASVELGGGDEYISRFLKDCGCPVFLILNKTDLLEPKQVLLSIEQYKNLLDFAEVVPVSALKGDNVTELLQVLVKYLPEGPLYYDANTVTDQPEQQIMAEIIREKVFELTREEIPHSVAVNITDMIPRENGVLYVGAAICVERDSQKVIIGKGGAMLKQIGSLARPELENIFGDKIFLELRVKVKKDWRNDDNMLKNFGYDSKEV